MCSKVAGICTRKCLSLKGKFYGQITRSRLGVCRSGISTSTIECSCQGRLTVFIVMNRDERSVGISRLNCGCQGRLTDFKVTRQGVRSGELVILSGATKVADFIVTKGNSKSHVRRMCI